MVRISWFIASLYKTAVIIAVIVVVMAEKTLLLRPHSVLLHYSLNVSSVVCRENKKVHELHRHTARLIDRLGLSIEIL